MRPEGPRGAAGTRTPREIGENVKAVDVRLTPDVLERIDEILTGAAGQVEELPR